jgi:hypothetical protein
VTPGAYLALRRAAAGRSIDDVAARVATEPAVPERDRRLWIAMIEADQAPLAAGTIVALRFVYPFDVEVLERLIDLRECGPGLPEPRICRQCGCSDNDPCFGPRGATCAWFAAEDRCTACPPLPAEASVPASSPVSVCVPTPSRTGAEA